MKFAVGFQLFEDGEEPFSDIVQEYKDSISEVFFAWQDIPTGRGVIGANDGYTDWYSQSRTETELKKIKSLGIKLDLLFNANCYGSQSLSERFANQIKSVIEYLETAVGGVDIVTTTSLFVAHVIKVYYPQIEVRASVNMKIGSVQAMRQVEDLFDSFHVQREYNRNLAYLKELKQWADAHNKKLIMLANSGCFFNCAGQIFHDNLVAHENEISEIKNLPNFNQYVCRRVLKNRENWHMLLQNTWVRPEDLHNYEGLFDTVKLATRMHALPGMVIGAYVRGYYYGNLLDLLEPGLGRAIAPYVINNSSFPSNWFTQSSSCDKICHKCEYCKSVFEKVLINTDKD